LHGHIVGFEGTSMLEDLGLGGPFYVVDLGGHTHVVGKVVFGESELVPY
jgi:hypothetical protein